MRGSVAIVLFLTAAQAAAWGLFQSSTPDPDYWKHAAIALLIGIFLSLPILGIEKRSLVTLLSLAFFANAIGGLIAIAFLVWRSDFSVGTTSTIAIGLVLLVPLIVAAANFVFGGQFRTAAALRRIVNSPEKAPQSNTVLESYLSELRPHSLSVACGLFILSLVATYMLEFSAAILSLILSLAVASHVGLTKLRVRNGSFASNAQEAEEIISYILAHHEQTGRPPGERLSSASIILDAVGEQNADGAIRGEV